MAFQELEFGEDTSYRPLLGKHRDSASPFKPTISKLDISPSIEGQSRGESFWIFYATCILTTVILLPVILGIFSQTLQSSLGQSSCLAGGTFLVPGEVVIWNSQYILSITTGFGTFNFAVAKTIDLCWDVVVGRGGQAALAWIAYRVFSKAIVFAMSTTEVSCDAYAAVAFYTGTPLGTWTVFLDFLRGRFPKTAFGTSTYVAMVLVGIYVLMFPTLLSATTSYGAISTPVVSQENTIFPLSIARKCEALVKDGSRVNLTNGYVVGEGAPPEIVESLRYYYGNHSDLYTAWEKSLGGNSTSYFLDGQSSGTPEMEVPSTINLTGHHWPLGPPLLNIVNFTDANISTCYHYENVVVTDKDLRHGAVSCAPSLKYQWGFSYLLLFITLALNAFAAVVLYSLHAYVYINSAGDDASQRQPSLWRWTIDLAREIHTAAGGREHDMDNKRLEKHMRGQKMTAIGIRPPSSGQLANSSPSQLQIVLLALICLLGPGMYNARENFSGASETSSGGLTSIVYPGYYAVLAIFGCLAGLFVNKLGTRTVLFCGAIGYLVWMSSFLSYFYTYSEYFYLVSAILLGVCAGFLWSASGQLITAYPVESSKGRYIAFFWAIYQLGNLLGSLVPLGQPDIESPMGSNVSVLVLMFFGACLVPFLTNSRHIVRSDNTKIAMMKNPTWKSELLAIWKVVRGTPYILYLFPMFFTSQWSYNYQFSDYNYDKFDSGTDSFNIFLFWLSHIFGALIFGFALDYRRFPRRKRALVAWTFLLVLAFVVWGAGLAVEMQTSDSDYWELGTKAYIGPMFLMMAYGMYDAVWQVFIYWLLGALTNNGRKLAILAGFYKGIQAAGSVVSWRIATLDSEHSTIVMLAICWAICAASLAAAFPVVFWKIKDTTSPAEDLKFSDQMPQDGIPQYMDVDTTAKTATPEVDGEEFEMRPVDEGAWALGVPWSNNENALLRRMRVRAMPASP